MVGNLLVSKPVIEILHLAREFLDIIDHDERIWGTLREGEEEVVEILSLHRIDENKVKILICECRNHRLCISPDSVDILYLTIAEMFDGFDMRIPGVFDGSDSSFLP